MLKYTRKEGVNKACVREQTGEIGITEGSVKQDETQEDCTTK